MHQIVYLGVDYPDYFQGFGTAFTPYSNSVVGIGETPQEAYLDAVDVMAQQDHQAAGRMPRKMQGHGRQSNAPDGAYHYVGIRWGRKECRLRKEVSV